MGHFCLWPSWTKSITLSTDEMPQLMLSTFHYPRACSYPAEPGIGTVGPSWLVMALMRQPSRCPHSNKTLQDLLKHSRYYSIKVSHHGKREYQKSQINLTSQSPLDLHWFIHPCNISNRPRHEERSKIQDDDVPLKLCFPSACQGRVAGEKYMTDNDRGCTKSEQILWWSYRRIPSVLSALLMLV